ncbi:MAG: UDP-N-acetylmuramyl-tripeptide synthetase [Negativibacillus sp.]|nr:UDP-N-acetylmuramyl-tripeptide synthetase [Negativibacillus sp.]
MNDSISIKQAVELLEQDGLLVGYDCPPQLLEHRFSHLSYSSADVTPDTFFICKGAAFKEEYLRDAIAKGAGVYLAQSLYEGVDCPHILVSDIRKAMSLVSIAFYQKAYRNFRVVGLTGTKGKTTTTYFMKNILDAFCRRNPQLCAAQKSAVLSTVEVDTGIEHHEAHLTTPESPDLQRYFAQTRDSGLPFLTMEVSSQAYKLSRVYGMDFDIGMFLNIGEDHIGPLEHTDFEDYFSCKLQLMEHCRTAIVNREMDHAQRVLEHARAHAQRVLTFGRLETADLDDDDCWILRDIQKEEQGFTFTTSHGLAQDSWRIRMAGRFNVENALAAILAAKALGVDDQSIREGLLQNEVQGRMNLFEKDGVTVLVDYAHNFLSFQKLYESLKADYPGQRIVVVVGCPGGKAQLRRRDIGTLSGQNADYLYLTAEDPQFEDVRSICEEIASFVKPYGTPYEIIEDRAQAVEKAITTAQKGDVIVLAAKGEEVYQKVRGEYVYYESDLAIAKRLLSV